MLGRTEVEAVSNYVDTIQSAVSCVSDSVVSVRGGYYVADMSHTLVMNRGNPVRLGGTYTLWLSIQLYYRIVKSGTPRTPWTVAEVGYRYETMDANAREILAYHWHPTGQSSFISQHLHIGYGAMIGREELQNAHLPTGYVSVIDIMRLLVREFGVSPRRANWESVLNDLKY